MVLLNCTSFAVSFSVLVEIMDQIKGLVFGKAVVEDPIMIISMQNKFRYWMRLMFYGIGAGFIAETIKRRNGMKQKHETARYWNAELSGRMSTPNLNGNISNAMRDQTSIVLLRMCGASTNSVLDVGCGFGDLAQALSNDGVERYVGVDLSDYVIERSNREYANWPVSNHCNLSFHQADLRKFSPPDNELFDVIVFNEVLKYVTVKDAVEQLKRYQRWLKPNGMFCVNITNDPKHRATFRALDDNFKWVYGMIYQQRPNGPRFRLTHNNATPPYQVGLFKPLPQ